MGDGLLDAQMLAFATVAFVLTLTPGADTMLVLRNTLRGGRADGIVTGLGVCSGLFVHALLSGLGLSVLLSTSATAFEVVRYAGAAYLVWLGAQSIRRANGGGPRTHRCGAAPRAVRRRRSFGEGFLTNLLNAKVAVFYLAFLPQFIGPDDPVVVKSVLLASIHNAMGLVWLSLVAETVARGRSWLDRTGLRAWLSRISGAVLVGFGARLALARH